MGYIVILNPQRLLLATRATDQDVKKLQPALPSCQIEWEAADTAHPLTPLRGTP